MALVHDFEIINHDFEPEIINGKIQTIKVSDDLIQYIWDSLKWIKSTWSNKCVSDGLSYHGKSLIDADYIMNLKSISLAWIGIFQNAPEKFTLRGGFLYEEGKYERIPVKKEIILDQLRNLVKLCEYAVDNNMKILHKGI